MTTKEFAVTAFLIIILCGFIPQALLFNFETRYPIIIRNRGGERSPDYFGASVSFLKSDQGSSWVIIGAPKANSTFPSHRDIVEPGAIWQCSLGQTPDKCRPLNMDPFGNNSPTDWRRGQYLGGPNGLALNDKNFISCASKWENRTENGDATRMLGACYKRPRQDLFQDPFPAQVPSDYRMVPVAEKEGNFSKFAQTGFAVHLPKAGNEIVMSAIGANRWRGSVIQYLSTDGGSSFTGKPYISTPSKYFKEVTPFNYFGYSITSGEFRDMNRPSSGANAQMTTARTKYVAGAPRGNGLTGKVIVFRFPEIDDGSLDIIKEINGEQLGSYFGASLLTIDVNNDGYDDLLVGAPRYTRGQKLRESPTGSLLTPRLPNFENGDEGAVYLYLSVEGGFKVQMDLITGENRAWSQFGTAMVSLGDLNKDGLKDFAISAPFGSDSGAVYIYHGSKGQISRHAQVIRARDVDTGLRGFGFSLAGNVDIDNNGFNDIAIGSFNSSQTVILRSKPVITVFGEVKSSEKRLSFTIEAFQIESCVKYMGNVDSVPSQLVLEVTLRSDAISRVNRVQIKFANDPGPQKHTTITYNETVSFDQWKCTKFDAIVVQSLESTSAQVVFRQTISKREEMGQVKARRMIIHPDGVSSTEGEKFDTFCKTCPAIDYRKLKPNELSLPLAVMCGDDDKCVADLQLAVEFRDIPDNGYLIGSSTSLFMDIVLTNLGETALVPAVIITWMRLKLRKIPPGCSLLSEEGITIVYKCTFGQLLEENKSANVTVEFDVSDLIVRETNTDQDLVFNVTATTTSDMVQPESSVTVLPLYASADLHVTGSRYLEPFNPTTKSPFVVFKYIFEIGMEGPSPVANIWAIFHLPVNLTTASQTVVNVRGVTVDKSQGSQLICQPTVGHFARANVSSNFDLEDNPDFDAVAAGIGGFLPKDKDVSRESNSSAVEKDRLLIHCDSPFVACMEVTCKIPEFRPGQLATVSFVVDMESDTIRSLLKTHKVSAIQIESKGKLILPEIVMKIQPPTNLPDETQSITIIEVEGYRVNKWTYILAVVVGLLALVCIFFCLYACGCFDKKRPPGADAVDGDANGKAEEMVPLQQHPDDEVEIDDEEKNGGMRVSTQSVSEPPDFIPTPRSLPIIEEPDENDYDLPDGSTTK